jgi:hypothetical protein
MKLEKEFKELKEHIKASMPKQYGINENQLFFADNKINGDYIPTLKKFIEELPNKK